MPKIAKPEVEAAPVRKVLTDFDIKQFGIFMEDHWKERESPRFGKLRFYDIPKAMVAYGAMTTGKLGGAMPYKYEEFFEKLDRLSAQSAKRDYAKTMQSIDQAKHAMVADMEIPSDVTYPEE